MGLREKRRGALGVVYLSTFSVLLAGALVCGLAAAMWSWLLPLGLVAASAAFQGVFEGQQAVARAKFDNAAFSLRVVIRAFLGLVGALTASSLHPTGEAALLGMALAYPLASLVGFRDVRSLRAFEFSMSGFWFLLRFGVPSAVATNLSLAVPAMIRSVVAASLGLTGAGGILLIIDLSLRLFATLGSSVNIVVVQNAIRAVESGNSAAINRQLRFQVVGVASLVLPIAVMFVFFRDQFADLVIPAVYHTTFQEGAIAAMFATGLMTIRQYSLDPLFVILGRSAGAPAGPLAMLFTLFVFAIAPPVLSSSPVQATMAQLVLASLAGCSVTVLSLLVLTRFVWPIADLIRLSAICIAMLLIGRVLPSFDGLLPATGKVLLLSLFFLAGMFAFNVLEARTAVRSLVGRRT